ncbi:MAG: hypothetical protein J6V06_09095 [Clostridia bacterium]|nr:hypothetical protein [Clostridia bacterium]
MREFLFRGKRKDNGKMVYGFLVMNKCSKAENGRLIDYTRPEIIPLGEIGEADYDGDGNYYEYTVIPETVGQYTGLTDRNDTKIYDGDILRYFVWGSYECFAVVRIGEYEQDGSGDEYPAIKIFGVYAEVKKYCPLIKEDGDYFPEYLKKSSLLEIGKDVFELVGNIHDNPELLKGGAE